MTINFPTSLDSLTNPTSGDTLNTAGVVHSVQHGNANDAIEALEIKVGADSSTDTNSLDYKVTTLEGATSSYALKADTLAQFAATTSLQLKGVISDETGSGALVFADTPTLVTPVLGVASATSINKVAVTAPATSATLTIADGKTLTVSKTLTLTGTDGTTMTFPATSDTLAGLGTANVFTTTQKIASASDPTLTLDEGNSGTSYTQIIDLSASIAQINKTSHNVFATIDINPLPDDGTSDGSFRFFRSTNTSGDVYFAIYKGDGSGTFAGQISANANRPTYLSVFNNFGIGISTPSVKTHIVDTTTTANAVLEVARIEARVSTAATGASAGFGVAQALYAESGTDGTYRLLGRWTGEWGTATDGSRKSIIKFTAADTAEREGMRIEANGSAVQLGFFGVASAARPSAFTQTYSTATHTHAAITASNPPAGGTGATAGAYDTAAHRDAMITSLTNCIADVANVKQVVNGIIDDLQSLGLLQ